MTYAQRLLKQLSVMGGKPRNSISESVFRLDGGKTGYSRGTVSTLNLHDLMKSKNLIEGEDYFFEGPYIFHINDNCIDRDVMDFLEIAGAIQLQ